ncbi:MAG: methyltransferase [Candidatus Heimdallarchaeota archaeon]|nr:methyltransferase [Candidatus Heimdallarchaeota archaeon]
MVKYDFPKYQIVLEIEEDVYFPAEDTFALIDAIQLEDNHKFVVELGGGTGIISIVLAKGHPTVRFLITDISFRAVKTIENNIVLNEIKNQIDLICMDKLEAIEHLSPDIIIWNPPYLPIDDETDNLKALEKLMLIGGNKGFEQAYKLIQYLKSQNNQVIFYTIFSSVGTTESTFTQMRKEGTNIEIIDEVNLFFEKLYLVKVNVGEKNRK